MSLINQMLRDLEQRDTPSVLARPTDPTNIPLMRDPVHSRSRALVWLVALASLTAGWLIWQFKSQVESKPDSLPAMVASTTETTIEKTEPLAIPPESVPEKQTLIETNSPSQTIDTAQSLPPETGLTSLETPIVTEQAPVLPEPLTKAKPNAGTSTKLSDNKPVKSNKNKAEALYRQADSSASRMMRKENLREVLEIDPYHLPARQKLLSLLLQERSTLELKRFLEESLALFPTHPGFITSLAHYYIQQKDFSGASITLERLDPFRINDTHYLSLLAASYQQQHLYSKALPIYQKLSQIQPEKAENWLGLGICAEKLQQPSSAAQAYRRALQGNGLGSDVVDYIKQRLRALNY